ncbi:proliferation marker protein Ki-67 [Ochotona princeps]|uniref:proliferation marker protein Ki-67 n=1 Tax=Ochotona princeps TaxID=9978 RepID=UPI002714EF77|nr:proliferation marker protein Ki-67 [Ochotona princeps]
MGPSARLVTIKRSGADGAHFPLSLRSCWFGRGIECDIRIQLPVVSKQHCKIEISEQEAVLHNFSSANPTRVNGSAIAGPVQLRHGDLITIVDRSFRYERESPQNGSKSPKCPRKTHEQSSRRVSRSGVSSDPDEKNQDSKVHSEITEGNVSGRPMTPANRVSRASRGSEDSGAQEVPGVQPSERPGGGHRHAGALASQGSEQSSERVVASFDGGLEPLPSTPRLHEGRNAESPFQELYQSLKKELDVKSQRGNTLQLRRPSGSQVDMMAEAARPDTPQRAQQQPGSGRPRAKCGRRSLGRSEPARPEPEGSPARPGAVGLTPAQSCSPLSGVSRVKTPMRYSHKRKHEDLDAAQLVTGGGGKAAAQSVSPGRLPSRSRAPAAAQGASRPAGSPARLSPRSRSSVPPRVDILPMETEIQNRPLAQWPAHTEKIPEDSPQKPGKSGPTQTSSGLPGLSSAAINNFGDSTNKNEGMSLKRRRVSFGGRLRPELFDENLPPNTPLKRGETPAKRRSLATPTVLKKIVKENPQPSGQEPSADISVEVPTQSLLRSPPAPSPPGSSAERRRSGRRSSASGGSTAPQQAGFPKRAGRKSGTLPSKRTSVSRSQHDILQMICSRRRSGASEANLIVAKSWADVVKLGAKQAQTKAVRPGPPRQVNRRQRRPDTPQKPADQLPGQFSTGHANSPCTVVIGRAHVAKVSAPARPYRMLNNLALNSRVMDYNEDLSGLTEMFKTPVKEKPATGACPVTLPDSEKSENEQTQADPAERIVGRTPRKTPPQEQKAVGERKDGEGPSKTCKESLRSRESSERTAPLRRLSRSWGQKCESAEDRGGSRVPCEEPVSAESKATEVPCESAQVELARTPGSRRSLKTPPEESTENERSAQKRPKRAEALRDDASAGLVKGVPGHSLDPAAFVKAMRRLPRTPRNKSQPLEDLTGFKELFQTPEFSNESLTVGKMTVGPCRTTHPELASPRTQPKTFLKQAGVDKELFALGGTLQTTGQAVHTPKAPRGDGKDFETFRELAKQKMDTATAVTGSKRGPKEKAPVLEDLVGLKELFKTPDHASNPLTVEKITEILENLPQPELMQTPTRLKSRLRTSLGKVNIQEELLELRKLTEPSEEAVFLPQEAVHAEKGVKAFTETPKQKAYSTEKISGRRRRPQTPKQKGQALEDLSGFKELFQTPGHATDLVSAQPGPVQTPAGMKARRKMSLGKEDVPEEPLTRSGSSRSADKARHTPQTPAGNMMGIKQPVDTPKHKLDLIENLSGRRRRPQTPKAKDQVLEDLTGVRELFLTPGHTEEPKSGGEATEITCKFQQLGPANTPTSTKKRRKTSPRNEKAMSGQKKLTRMSGEATPLPRAPVGDDRSFEISKIHAEQKVDPASRVTNSKSQRGAREENFQPMEDLAGFRELFRTPGHTDEPKSGGKNMQIPRQSPQAELENMWVSVRTTPKPPATTAGSEELSALMLSHAARETALTPEEAEDDDKTIKALKKSAKQKAEPSTRVTGSRRRSKAPREKTQHLEDLTGLKELFQTPDHTDSVSDGKSTRMSRKFPALENTPVSVKAWSKTPGRKVGLEQLMPTDTLKTSEGDTYVKTSMRSSKQRLDLAGSVATSRRWPRTPKEKGQPEEDLAGLRELFQTPTPTEESMRDGETTGRSCASEQREPASSPTSRRHLKTDLANGNVLEEYSVQTDCTQLSREAAHTPKVSAVPGGCEKEVEKLKGSAKRKLDSATSAAGGKRQRETPKDKFQPVEDLDGVKELFQTPVHTEKPTGDVKATETTELSCGAPGADSVDTQTRTRRQLRTAVQKADVKAEISTRTRRKLPQPSGEPTPVPGTPDEGVRALEESEEQELDLAENEIGSRRQPRTRKAKTQPLEQQESLKELHTQELVSDGKDAQLSCSAPEPGNTLSRTRRQRKIQPEKADVKAEISTWTRRKVPQPSGEPTPVPGTPDEGVRALEESEEQRLESAAGVIGSRRQPRTRKAKTQPLEQQESLKELHTQELVSDGKDAQLSCSAPEPGNTPSRTRRQLRTAVQKADVKAEVSTRISRKVPQPSGEPTPVPGTPDEGVRALEESEEQRLESAAGVIGSRRQPRTRKAKTQPAAEPGGLKELHTAGHTQASATDEKTTELSCGAPGADSVDTQTRTRRQLRTAVQKADVKAEISTRTRRKVPQPSGEPMPVPGTPDEGVRALEESEEQKLDLAENEIGSRRQPRTRKAKTQPLEQQESLKELHTQELVSDGKDAQLSCSAPEPGNTLSRTRRQRKIQPEKADVKAEISTRTRRKVPQPSGEPTPVPGTPDEGVRALEESEEQRLESAAGVIGSRRQPRTRKAKTQPLEQQESLKGLSPTPGHMEELTVGVHAFKEIPKPSPGRGKSPEMLRRVLRASRLKPVEDPAGLQSTSSPSLAPQSGRGEDGSLPRTKKSSSVATPQELVAKRPANKRRRSASREKDQSPQPEQTAKRPRASAKKVAESLNTRDKATKQEDEEAPITPDKGMPAHRRCQKKTNVKEGQRLRFLLPAENIKMKKNEVSDKQELQKPDEGAERLRSRGTRVRFGKENTGAAKESSPRVEVSVETESGLPAAAPAGPRIRPGTHSVGRASEQRVTRGGGRRAQDPDKDKDIPYAKRMRTRRHREEV